MIRRTIKPQMKQLGFQFSALLIATMCLCCSVDKLCLTLWDPMNCSTSGFPVLHYLLEFAQNYVYWVSDTFWSSHPTYMQKNKKFNTSNNYQLLYFSQYMVNWEDPFRFYLIHKLKSFLDMVREKKSWVINFCLSSIYIEN